MFGNRYNKDSGVIVVNGQAVGTTIQCCHCGNHFVSTPGSGKKRGFCYLCNGILCGKHSCMTHVPYEARVEYQEALNAKNKGAIKKLTSRYPDIVNLSF